MGVEVKVKVVINGADLNIFNLRKETTCRSVWKTGRSKRVIKNFRKRRNMTEEEFEDIVTSAKRHAYSSSVEVSAEEYILFKELADLCYLL